MYGLEQEQSRNDTGPDVWEGEEDKLLLRGQAGGGLGWKHLTLYPVSAFLC